MGLVITSDKEAIKVMLEFLNKNIDKIINEILKENKGLTVEGLIKEALKRI